MLDHNLLGLLIHRFQYFLLVTLLLLNLVVLINNTLLLRWEQTTRLITSGLKYLLSFVWNESGLLCSCGFCTLLLNILRGRLTNSVDVLRAVVLLEGFVSNLEILVILLGYALVGHDHLLLLVVFILSHWLNILLG